MDDTLTTWIEIKGGNIIKWNGDMHGTASGYIVGPYSDTLLRLFQDKGIYVRV